MAAPKDYWFKPKRYGWGWGLPATWQGWVSFGIFITVWLIALAMLVPTDSGDLKAKNIIIFITIMLLDVAGLVYISFKHGESPKWRWGNKK
jgi:hypothetical protein